MRGTFKRVGTGLSTVRELVGATWRGPRWWLVPVLFLLLPLAALLVFLTAVPLVAPFVYAVF